MLGNKYEQLINIEQHPNSTSRYLLIIIHGFSLQVLSLNGIGNGVHKMYVPNHITVSIIQKLSKILIVHFK